MNKEIKFYTTEEIAIQCGLEINVIRRWASQKGMTFPWKNNQKVSLDDFIYLLSKSGYTFSHIESTTKPSVLIIDDESNVVRSIERIFTNNHFQVFSAENGFKAGLILTQQKPLIVTLDLNLKDLNGFDVLKIIRGLRLEQKTWVVVISGETDDRLQQAIEDGADFYLKKPFSKNDLDKIIRKLNPIRNEGELHERSSIRRAC